MSEYGAQMVLFGWCMTGHHNYCVAHSTAAHDPSISQLCRCECHGAKS